MAVYAVADCGTVLVAPGRPTRRSTLRVHHPHPRLCTVADAERARRALSRLFPYPPEIDRTLACAFFKPPGRQGPCFDAACPNMEESTCQA